MQECPLLTPYGGWDDGLNEYIKLFVMLENILIISEEKNDIFILVLYKIEVACIFPIYLFRNLEKFLLFSDLYHIYAYAESYFQMFNIALQSALLRLHIEYELWPKMSLWFVLLCHFYIICVTYRENFLKTGFHAVYYIASMPRLVQIEAWFFGIICIM